MTNTEKLEKKGKGETMGNDGKGKRHIESQYALPQQFTVLEINNPSTYTV